MEIFQAETRSYKDLERSRGLAGAAALAGVIGVGSAVTLFSGDATANSLKIALLVAALVGILSAAALGLWAVQRHQGVVRQLTVQRNQVELLVKITPDIAFGGNLKLDFGWQHGASDGIAQSKILWCDVYSDDEPVIRLMEEIGPLNDYPDLWHQKAGPPDIPYQHGSFTCAQISEFVEILRTHCRFPRS